MNLNPLEYRLPHVVIDSDDYMKARIRQDLDYAYKQIAHNLSIDTNFLLTLIQNMDIRKEEDVRQDAILYIPTLFIVPAQQVIAERKRRETAVYNG
jgi:hypothetical protein